MVSPFRRRQAQAEVDRRRKERETYTVPVVAKPGRATAEGELVVTAAEVQEFKAFATEFYQKIYTKAYKAELDALLQEYPDDLGRFHQTLVVETAVVSFEDFWQGYLYRCDVDRVLKEWERRPESRQALKAGSSNNENSGSDNGNDKKKQTKKNNDTPSLWPKTPFSKQPSAAPSSTSTSSCSSSTSTSSTKENKKQNRRADALRGASPSNSRKGESISERFNRTSSAKDTTESATASSSNNDDKTTEKNSRAPAAESTTPATASEKLRQYGKLLQKIVVGLVVTAFVLDYARRLGAGKVVCEALTKVPRVGNRNLVDFLPSGLCDDKHAMVLVTDNNGNDDGAPRVKRRAMGWGGRGNTNNQNNNDGASYGSNDGSNNSNNPLWNSWRKVAEDTVNQHQQQGGGQYGGGGTGLAPSGGNHHGIEPHQPHQNEGIVGYFKDKFGRAGVVVEQHVVHHHVHHVIHEHR